MFDSVNFKLTQAEVNGIDFLSEIPCHLDEVSEHLYDGTLIVMGRVGGLKVSLNRFQVKVGNGSLCKWYLGDNFKTMGRGDAERAIEKLSDYLHLPIDKAIVTRIDLAQNFIMEHPIGVYLNHLGPLSHAKRLEQPDGLYYYMQGGCLCIYDKNKEQKSKHESVPSLYESRNVLRYEQRYTNRIATRLNVPEITGALLYNEIFYIDLLNRWRDSFKKIEKINDYTFNFNAMRTKQDLYKMGVLSLIEQAGGQIKSGENLQKNKPMI